MIQQSRSEAPQDLHHRSCHGPSGAQVVQFLLSLHPLRGQDDEHRVLVEKVADQNTAKFIVVPLFMLRPAFALSLVKLIHQLQTFFVGVVPQPALQDALIEIEPVH